MTDMDLFYQNDKGESINISKSVRDMNEKIDRCLKRVLRSKEDSTTIQCSGETIHLKMEGLI